MTCKRLPRIILDALYGARKTNEPQSSGRIDDDVSYRGDLFASLRTP